MRKISNTEIKKLEDLYKQNKFSDHGHIEVYQSDHNLNQMERKNLLYLAPQHWWPDTLDNMYNSAWVYHFNGIPANPLQRGSDYFMERAYNELNNG